MSFNILTQIKYSESQIGSIHTCVAYLVVVCLFAFLTDIADTHVFSPKSQSKMCEANAELYNTLLHTIYTDTHLFQVFDFTQ